MRGMRGLALLCSATIASGAIIGCSVNMEIPSETGETSETVVVQQGPYRPQDDYYMYVNEEALANAVFEYGASQAGTAFDGSLVDDRIDGIIDEVVAGSGYAYGTEEYIIQQAYNLRLAYDPDNAEVPEDLDAVLHEIDGVSSIEEFLELDARIARDYAVPSYFNVGVDFNYFNADHRILGFEQMSGFLGADFDSLEETYAPLDTVKTNASLYCQAMGHDKDSSDQIGTQLGYIAMNIYNATDLEVVRELFPIDYYQVLTFDEAQAILSNVDFAAYLTEMGYDSEFFDEFACLDLGQLGALNDALTEDNLDALKAWKLAQFGMEYQNFVAMGYDALADYVTIDYATPEEQARSYVHQNCVDQTDPLYLEQYYTEETDEALISMCDDIREGYRDLITNATWLSEESRQGILVKLDNIVYVTGGSIGRADPDEWADLCYDDYYSFYLSYRLHKLAEKTASLAEPVDRTQANMPMQMLNACYNQSMNNITITAAITIEPFFSPDQDYYTNLGGLGMVIGHEMGHAFDSNCIAFDQDGNYNPSWICDEDVATLNARNVQAVSYFEDNFTVFGVYHVDGEQTLGENYADLGSLECITTLAHTPEQLEKLFESYATIWCGKELDTAVIDQIDNDEHSPSIIRVNAILSTLDAFYETYDVREGDGMWIAPENRISRWH
ncbi:MAG: M13 family metallopeptidase [Clostridiales bacterium]|nr:M13 family metallopeptidase [Clostridiales bacterium]